MVFPWMFDDIAALQPLKKVAEAVANAEDWSRLYDSAKLQQNRVPVAAATYCEVRGALVPPASAHARRLACCSFNTHGSAKVGLTP